MAHKKRIAWLTDIHLEFLNSTQLNAFISSIGDSEPDAVLLGGDTGTAGNIIQLLKTLEFQLSIPIYFVLGNHDFYGGSIRDVRTQIAKLSEKSLNLFWLPSNGVVELSADTALVGHGAWADGRFGGYNKSPVILNDYIKIREFQGLLEDDRLKQLNTLGDEAAVYLQEVLLAALAAYHQVILLTHVQPFRESCWYAGEISNDDFLPHFSCKAVGDVLLEIMKNHLDRKLTVLCGHTHGEGQARILPNLHVITGGADYRDPIVQGVFDPDKLPDALL